MHKYMDNGNGYIKDEDFPSPFEELEKDLASPEPNFFYFGSLWNSIPNLSHENVSQNCPPNGENTLPNNSSILKKLISSSSENGSDQPSTDKHGTQGNPSSMLVESGGVTSSKKIRPSPPNRPPRRHKGTSRRNKKTTTPAMLEELAKNNPKKWRRIMLNRVSAIRAKARKKNYVFNLDDTQDILQEENANLSKQLAMYERDINSLDADNMKIQQHLREELRLQKTMTNFPQLLLQTPPQHQQLPFTPFVINSFSMEDNVAATQPPLQLQVSTPNQQQHHHLPPFATMPQFPQVPFWQPVFQPQQLMGGLNQQPGQWVPNQIEGQSLYPQLPQPQQQFQPFTYRIRYGDGRSYQLQQQ